MKTRENAEMEAVQTALLAAMERHEAAWNNGDLPGLLSAYWQDDRLRFASGKDIYRGYPNIQKRFQERYPDSAAMGKLAFSDIEVSPLTVQDALVFGRWTIEHQDALQTGLFTLHFHRINNAWKIVNDHTSTA